MNIAAMQHQMVVNAVRSWGPIVTIDSDGFLKILKNKMEAELEPNPLVVTASGGWFSTVYTS